MERLNKSSKNQREGIWPCNANDKNEIVMACVVCLLQGVLCVCKRATELSNDI